jgi:hypothetical protein
VRRRAACGDERSDGPALDAGGARNGSMAAQCSSRRLRAVRADRSVSADCARCRLRCEAVAAITVGDARLEERMRRLCGGRQRAEAQARVLVARPPAQATLYAAAFGRSRVREPPLRTDCSRLLLPSRLHPRLICPSSRSTAHRSLFKPSLAVADLQARRLPQTLSRSTRPHLLAPTRPSASRVNPTAPAGWPLFAVTSLAYRSART